MHPKVAEVQFLKLEKTGKIWKKIYDPILNSGGHSIDSAKRKINSLDV